MGLLHWQPQHCKCRVIIEQPLGGEMVYSATEFRCLSHILWSGQALINQLVSESRQVEYSFDEIKKVDPKFEKGDGNFSFDTERKLRIKGVPPEAQQRVRTRFPNAQIGFE